MKNIISQKEIIDFCQACFTDTKIIQLVNSQKKLIGELPLSIVMEYKYDECAHLTLNVSKLFKNVLTQYMIDYLDNGYNSTYVKLRNCNELIHEKIQDIYFEIFSCSPYPTHVFKNILTFDLFELCKQKNTNIYEYCKIEITNNQSWLSSSSEKEIINTIFLEFANFLYNFIPENNVKTNNNNLRISEHGNC